MEILYQGYGRMGFALYPTFRLYCIVGFVLGESNFDHLTRVVRGLLGRSPKFGQMRKIIPALTARTPMLSQHQHRLAAWLISPYGLAVISYVVFLSAILFPPHLYSEVMEEPNYMFLDPSSLFFFTTCMASFLAGVWLIDAALPVKAFVDNPIYLALKPTTFLLLPLLVLLPLSLASNLLVIRDNPLVLELLFSQGGNEIKEGLETRGTLGLASIYLLGVIWWSIWRCDQLALKGKQRLVVKIVQYAAIMSIIVSTTLKLARSELMPVITGLAVIYTLRKIVRRDAGHSYLLKTALSFTVSVAAIFLLITFIRGESDTDRLRYIVMAYTISSYNRLAALLGGRLQYPYAGRGIYLCSFLGFNNMLNAVIPFRDFLSWPTFYESWQSEFRSTWRAGLNGFSIWSSAFGFIYAELGWWSPIYVFFQGLLCGTIWRSAKSGHVLGIALYPWVAFCILYWLGTNYLFDNRFVVLAIDAAALTVYERYFVAKFAPQVARASLSR